MNADELIRSIRLPRNKNGWIQYYRKVGTRKAQAISKVCFAGAMKLEGAVLSDLRLALGSVAPTPIRCTKTEEALRGKSLGDETCAIARSALESEIVPIDDIRSTAAYRLQVAGNLLDDFLSGPKTQ
jgi:CO/xanthine dehydrogenase FAD-binding subunit